jgi:gliding motility-associated protein GldM
MGSKNCPETPRQRMISMMYLVLTALLALNVSADVLNSFIVVNDGIVATNTIFSQKVEASYSLFEAAMAENPEKVGPGFEKAKQVKEYASNMVEYIENLKAELIAITEGVSVEQARNMSASELKRRDNYDIPTTFLIGQDQTTGKGGRANLLKMEIIKFKEDIISVLDENSRSKVNLGLNVEDMVSSLDKNVIRTWEIGSFYKIVQIACVAILNKLILEVRNSEADVVAQLYADVDAGDFKFNKISAKVVPKSNFVITGGEFEAEIFVAAYDTLTTPEVIIGSGVDSVTMKVLGTPQTLEGEGGVVKYKTTAGGIGVQTYGGVINVPLPTGGVKSYPFKGEYVVAAPTATVSADKMNVFYIGVDNPVSISVPGIPNDKVRPSITNGRMNSTSSGKYNVRVESGNEATINVSADMDGQMRSMGTFKFRVRRVPDPVPYIANVREGNIPKGNLVANPIIIPRMENFEFDLHFTIISYRFIITQPGGDIIERDGSGGRLTQEMINYINNARRGTRCYIENIRVQGPDGAARNVAPISLRIV